MIGATEILMIALIAGIIFGRNAIDRTWKKHPDEGLGESFAADIHDFYKENPKRLIILALAGVAALVFLVVLLWWVFTQTGFLKMIGLDQ